ncbi:hypothetical protein F66182_3314 [Fusarium sp. NRRL 66182]|nr:hypothetical protein F66182_3314 [Fusarium sp. NRRL 66182]
MADFAARRQANIKRNQTLLDNITPKIRPRVPELDNKSKSVKRKQKPDLPGAPTRESKRIAQPSTRPAEKHYEKVGTATSSSTGASSAKVRTSHAASNAGPERDAESTVVGWTAWEPEAGEPFRDAAGTFHFESHPHFQPNKSPEEIMREGSFGGSYWRPLFSKHLGITIQDDWRELPASWTAGLDVDAYLASASYNPEVNKYGVSCGQSIEQWEAAGWIAHEYDVRGWFQWYCRYWMGRRCADDERQISRWRKCVGETGRWRRILLKKYVALGIRTVFADEDEHDEDGADVSPVVHQTCHHWAYEVRQDALDRFWDEAR